MKKWWILFFYIFIFSVVFMNKDLIFAWIHESDASDLPFMFLLSVLLAAIPFIPFTLFAGLMGAKYGVFLGTVINWSGGLGAAMIYFLVSKTFFRDYFNQYLMKIKGMQRFQMMLERNAFITILLARLIAIFPPPVVNMYSGVSLISFRTFLIATAIGLIPPMFIVAFSGEQVFLSFFHLSIGLCIYLLFLLTIFLFYKMWFRQSSRVS
ncbi:TVP38/TMEM64 family protein [Cytobacillus depressus]|uniref:TVP38/TMEM64 family membrane protein n=1 Tax=Cytobacillus depressus TaxID=1602942 RepID=A0A6L3V426_9BACI|nr:VTT domain-containing protein [Cytobacillus depressus]KAB2334818.1 TVP38/TMEM64 family protein [Cytobacillus depressus]